MKLDDERVQFYLRHRDQLEEWLALRPEAAAAIDDWLTALRPDIEFLAAELGGDVELVVALEETAWPSIFLKRSAWPGNTNDEMALIGLQWVRGKTLLGASTAPYVGVRCDKATSLGRALRVDEEFQSNRRIRKDKNVPWWPALGSVPAQEIFPERADEYRQVLLKSINDAWTAYASAIDRAVSIGVASTAPIAATPTETNQLIATIPWPDN